MTTIDRVLIANRGEIACRIIRTCHRMGIYTVAVFSDADSDAPHVAMADLAMRIGPAPSVDSYLRVDRIIEAARASGCDAVHPGYGFLAENPALATACTEAGITFIGPSADAIALLGSKKASKELVASAGVPVIPAWEPDDVAAMQFPVLLKASAGGGGKGMQIVRTAADLPEALAAARRVARSSFGDDTVLVERYVERPRHVEIQILADSHGNAVHLFERECSIQRRHQKIIEESPSTAVSDQLRDRMGTAAVAVARAAGYVNAGTVEFILAPGGDFYFLEVNTRLQVEHPVTEMITGLDLVREQIRVARGEALGYAQADLSTRGAAIECRLYAENADEGFLPTSGTVAHWSHEAIDGLRIDAGVESGSEVGIHYDPMLAKVVTHAPTRSEAIDKMRRALRNLRADGITTNRSFLLRVIEHPAFAAGEIDTHFIDDHRESLAPPEPAPEILALAAAAATGADFIERRRQRSLLPALEPGFRNNPSLPQQIAYRWSERVIDVSYRNLGADRLAFEIDGAPLECALVDWDGSWLTIEAAGVRQRLGITRAGTRTVVTTPDWAVTLAAEPRFPEPGSEEIAGACVAPMPGKVIQIAVATGASVASGDTLVILEAMKMEHRVVADRDGQITSINVGEGDQVEEGALLIVIGD